MQFKSTLNGETISLKNIPVLSMVDFRDEIINGVGDGARLVCLSVRPMADKRILLFGVLAWKESGTLSIAFTEASDSFQSITPDCEQAHLFEREIAEQWGVIPDGHPWPKPARFQPLRNIDQNQNQARPACGVVDFFHMEGDEIHEVAVGPVHAGIIEPGHFRFQCHGETVYHLEISLGYQHRGVERALVGGPDKRTIHYMETLSGDTTIGHALAYSQAVESLAGASVSLRAHVIRGIAQELERVANHIGDLGALAGDIGFLPTQSYCGRIRGDVLNMTAAICGNRFGRGLVRPGGVGFDIDEAIVDQLTANLEAVTKDAESAIGLLWNTPSVLARFEGTGPVSIETCRAIGMVGVAARACSWQIDARVDFPYGIFHYAHIPVSTGNSGDVFSRALVRWKEIQRSLFFICEQLRSLPRADMLSHVGSLRPDSVVISMVEGWRGEICHVAFTDKAGRIENWKIVDPSFKNWFGLACAMRNQQISDFPVCNKSFNLSYCGHDL